MQYRKVAVEALPRISSRLTFLYAERCVINREDSALTLKDENGTVFLPAASVAALLIGPGVSMTHRAIALAAECGASVVWVGEGGTNFYAAGRPLSGTTALLEAQARAASNRRVRLDVARTMYCMRFAGEDVTGLSMEQLRGREGVRMAKLYRRLAGDFGVPWHGRRYDPADYGRSDPINQAITSANACLYGVAHAVICALGCSPGLGIVHSGNPRSFVYDIADLYKADIAVAAAFEVISEGIGDISRRVRIAIREKMKNARLLERMVSDIHTLFRVEDDDLPEVLVLWDYQAEAVPAQRNWGA